MEFVLSAPTGIIALMAIASLLILNATLGTQSTEYAPAVSQVSSFLESHASNLALTTPGTDESSHHLYPLVFV
jgi:hypothetical protein